MHPPKSKVRALLVLLTKATFKFGPSEACPTPGRSSPACDLALQA